MEAVCNKDCFNCPFEDCINDSLDLEDYRLADKIERAILNSKTAKQRTIAEYNRAYYEANKDKIAAGQRAYYEANKEKIAAYKQAYYEANKDKIAARRRAYREANKDKINAYFREYRRKHNTCTAKGDA